MGNTYFVQTQRFCICSTTDCNQHFFCFKGFYFAANFYLYFGTNRSSFYGLYFRFCKNGYTGSFHLFPQHCCQFSIHHGQQFRHCFYNSYFCAKTAVCCSQFHTDNATADNQQCFRHMVKCQSTCGIYTSRIFLYTRNRRNRRYRTCCQNHFIKRNIFFCAVFFHNFQCCFRSKRCCTFDNANLICFHQTCNTTYQLVCYSFFSGLYRFPVNAVDRNLDTQIVHMFCFCERFCRMEQYFCRDTSNIQACTSQFIFFNQCNFATQLCCTDRSNITTGAAAYHNNGSISCLLCFRGSGNRCRCGCWSRSRCRSLCNLFASLTNVAQQTFYRYIFPFFCDDFQQHAVSFTFNFTCQLISCDFQQHIAFFYGIPFLFQPFGNSAFFHGQTQLGHFDFKSHSPSS